MAEREARYFALLFHALPAPIMKFVRSLDSHTQQALADLARNSPSARIRQRAHAVLLSNKGYRLNRIADIFDVDRDTVSRWLNDWNQHQFDGLSDAPRSGRPPKLNDDQQQQALKMVLEEPRQIKHGLARISEHFKLELSLDWVRRLLTRHAYRYKRLRPKKQRDEALFRAAQVELAQLQKQDDDGELYYVDASGFALRLPYAWQARGHRIALPQQGGQRVNVLALLRRDSTVVPYVVEAALDSDTVIACLDHFAASSRRPCPTVLVLDNAPIHRSAAFQAALERWKGQGITCTFLPSYSPELNLIEHLWKQIKYYWLPFSAYESYRALKAALEEILSGVGTKYRITFA